MTCLNVSKIINEWIEAKLNLPFTIQNDVINKATGDAACLRHDPAPAAERRFTDGSRLVKWNLAYYIRSANRENARKWAHEITDGLDGVQLQAGGGVVIDVEAATLPQFISVDDKNQTLYSAAIVATYLEPSDNMEA